MSLTKRRGRTVRLHGETLPLLERLRQAYVRAEIDGRKASPDVSDADVVAFAIRAAAVMMTPRFAVVNRDQCAKLVDKELVMGMADFAGRPEPERLAMLDMILARSSEFSAFHSTSPLLAATPEGRVT